jgi:hypothetical protein
MLEPVPVAALGRLAVDQRWHGCGPAFPCGLDERIIMTAAVSGGIRLRRVTFFSSLPSASSSVITSSPSPSIPAFFQFCLSCQEPY